MKRARDAQVRTSERDETRQPVVIRQMRMHDVESVQRHEPSERRRRSKKGDRILSFRDDRMRKSLWPELRFELVSADVRIMRIDACRAKRLHLGKRRRRRAGPAIAGRKMEDFHVIPSVARNLVA